MGNVLSAARKSVFYFLLILLAFIMLFPFWFMFIGGFRVTAQINSTHFTMVPEYGFTYLNNFHKLFFDSVFPRALLNTAFIAIIKTVACLFLASLAGFAFSKMDFPGKKPLFYFVLATMMIPTQVTLIPMYVMMSRLKWTNTYYALIIPGIVTAFGIFIMKQYMESIPNEVINHAKIDGCSDSRTFWSIALPMVQPGMVVLGIITFMGSWNDFLWPLIILSKEKMYTVTLTLATFRGSYNFVDYGTVLGGSFISALPMIILFIAFREKLLTGLVAGSIK